MMIDTQTRIHQAQDIEKTCEQLEHSRDEWAAMCGRYKQERDIAEQDATNYHARTIELINERDKTRQERDEARADLEFRRGLYKVQEEFLEAARRDLAEAQIECLEQARLLSMSSEREAKLIYERDEAIRLHKKSLCEREAAERETDDMLERAQKVERERDDARKIASELAIQAERLRKGRDEARELVKAYQDYAQLLGDEINDMTSVAYVHGWRSNRYEQGKVLREKIKQMEETK